MLVRGEGDGFFDVVLAGYPPEDSGHHETAAGVGDGAVGTDLVDVPAKVVETATTAL